VNRKQWIIAGIVVVALLAAGFMFFVFVQNIISDQPVETKPAAPASVLVYCSEDGEKPCVVSFSLDVDGNMLVNILLPELSYPNFHLKILSGKKESEYSCQRVNTALNNVYCLGERFSPGESLHLMLFSTKDETLLAEGDLAIIGLALPTLAVVSPTLELSPASEMTLTETTPAIISTPTTGLLPTKPESTPNFTSTPPSYPNPTSYP
jgi:hypothetical protein